MLGPGHIGSEVDAKQILVVYSSKMLELQYDST